MGRMSMPVAASLRVTDFMMELVTADLTDDTARRRARGEQGASIAWAIGHLAHYRYEIMKLLGQDEPNPFAARFGNAGATDGRDYPTIAELRAGWRRTAAMVIPVVEAASDDAIMALLAGAGSPRGEKRVLDTLASYMWHESYHMGQLGTLRTLFGMKGTAELVAAAGA